jgi:hypothetical protein
VTMRSTEGQSNRNTHLFTYLRKGKSLFTYGERAEGGHESVARGTQITPGARG